jgi:hypothetical protein
MATICKESIPRKRGRPRKNSINLTNSNEKKNIVNKIKMISETHNNDSKEEDIILHLPLSITDLGSNSDNSNELDEKVRKEEQQELYNEINEKNKTIRKLKDELLSCKTALMEYTSTSAKEVKVNISNMCLIDNSTKQNIIVEKTDIKCWWCTYSFENVPVFLPDRYSDSNYYVFGCFCSVNCAASYNLLYLNDNKINERYSLLKKIYNIENIQLAPKKEILITYGGNKSIEEFRQYNKYITKKYRYILPPMIAIIPLIEEKVIENNIISYNAESKNLSNKNIKTLLDIMK